MYKSPDIMIPNFFEVDTLPFLKQDSYPLDRKKLTSERAQVIRNFTHRHERFMAKVFLYFPKVLKEDSSTAERDPESMG